ncbi:Enamine deaminase RidA, house cleaning of reactive enamine intermediates, YjgF/YER057c/UK114 family [Sphingomonas sp. YR710]|uniref:RidA family protein n=1 Tax=Sphingomonas sp. YR710 TaxID=1882773 RepID=UPI00088868C3|nr:RidA family protein [Sphingomonas sp. YR710]SDD20836.1 Enamine deaminase RidA, house cleaning of reactive enamine intermediates, YjgF/YER057c/UK114 family [Sphingomonas sp. YR710]
MITKNATALLMTAAAIFATTASAAGIERKAAPNAAIASSAAVPVGSKLFFISGTTASPIDPKDTDSPGAFGDTKAQTLSILTKMKTQLAELGLTMGDIVKLTVFMVGDPATGGKMDREGMTASYKMFFGTPDQPNLPTRSTVQVAALGRPQTLIEIEAIAAKAP